MHALFSALTNFSQDQFHACSGGGWPCPVAYILHPYLFQLSNEPSWRKAYMFFCHQGSKQSELLTHAPCSVTMYHVAGLSCCRLMLGLLCVDIPAWPLQ